MRDPAALVSVEEYLSTSYSPDCDYVNGVLEDRNVGRTKPARAQTEIAFFLHRLEFRVTDVCAIIGEPREEVFTTAPLLCVEVLSPEDRASRIEEKIADYLRMGVRYVWVVDPYVRKAWTHTREGAVESSDGALRTKDPDIEMPLSEVWE